MSEISQATVESEALDFATKANLCTHAGIYNLALSVFKLTADLRADLERVRKLASEDSMALERKWQDALREVSRLTARVIQGEDSENCPFCAVVPFTGNAQDVPMCGLCQAEAERDQLRAKNAALSAKLSESQNQEFVWAESSDRYAQKVFEANEKVAALSERVERMQRWMNEHKMDHAIGCPFPEGCSCEAGAFNARIDALAVPTGETKPTEGSDKHGNSRQIPNAPVNDAPATSNPEAGATSSNSLSGFAETENAATESVFAVMHKADAAAKLEPGLKEIDNLLSDGDRLEIWIEDGGVILSKNGAQITEPCSSLAEALVEANNPKPNTQ